MMRNDQQMAVASTQNPDTVSAQFFFAGKLIDYTGSAVPENFVLPEDMEIVPWEHPRFFCLTIKGRLVAGPARREVLESFVYDLCTKPEKAEELTEIRGEVEQIAKMGSG